MLSRILMKFLPRAHLRKEGEGQNEKIFKFTVFCVKVGILENAENNFDKIFALNRFCEGKERGKV